MTKLYLTSHKWAFVSFDLYLLNAFQYAFYVLQLKHMVKLFAVLFRALIFDFVLSFFCRCVTFYLVQANIDIICRASLCKKMKAKTKFFAFEIIAAINFKQKYSLSFISFPFLVSLNITWTNINRNKSLFALDKRKRKLHDRIKWNWNKIYLKTKICS